jgi:hypothetical protein
MDFVNKEVSAETIAEPKNFEAEVTALSQFDLALVGGGLGEVIFG